MMPIQQQGTGMMDDGMGLGEDPSAGMGMQGQEPMPDDGMGMDMQQPEMEPEPIPEPAPAPIDPAMATITEVLSMDPQEAIRRVYQLAASAARVRSRLRDSARSLDARIYHDLLSKNPEVRFATELLTAKRELDTLAQERRRLNLEADKARKSGKQNSASLYEVQAASVTSAMEQVAGGTLLFLALPSDILDRVNELVPQPQPQTQTQPQPQIQQPTPQPPLPIQQPEQ